MQLNLLREWKLGVQALLFLALAVQSAATFSSSENVGANEFMVASVSTVSLAGSVAGTDAFGESAILGGGGESFQGVPVSAQLSMVDTDVDIAGASAAENGLVNMVWIALAAVLGFSVVARRQPSSGPQSNQH